MTLSKSPDRGSFSLKVLAKKVESGEKSLESAEQYLEFLKTHAELVEENENKPEFKINNLEYDLRSTDWILKKVRNNKGYAQNLYAAICNNEFIRNDVWPLLTREVWHCSWRYAAGIISDMRQEGDYIDWYCSGITDSTAKVDDDQYQNMSKDAQEHYLLVVNYVSESVVTDEIREDLLKLGWVVQDNDS